MGQNGLLVSELSWRLVIDLLVPFKIKRLKTAHGKSAIISAMKRTLSRFMIGLHIFLKSG